MGSNQTPFGDTNLSWNGSTNVLTNSSDFHLKENIHPIEDAIEIIRRIDGVRYNWKEQGSKSVGFIAQDVEKLLPELVSKEPISGKLGLAYSNMVAVVCQGLKELNERVEKLEGK